MSVSSSTLAPTTSWSIPFTNMSFSPVFELPTRSSPGGPQCLDKISSFIGFNSSSSSCPSPGGSELSLPDPPLVWSRSSGGISGSSANSSSSSFSSWGVPVSGSTKSFRIPNSITTKNNTFHNMEKDWLRSGRRYIRENRSQHRLERTSWEGD